MAYLTTAMQTAQKAVQPVPAPYDPTAGMTPEQVANYAKGQAGASAAAYTAGNTATAAATGPTAGMTPEQVANYASGQANAGAAAAAAGDTAAQAAYTNPLSGNTNPGSAYTIANPSLLSGPGAYEEWLKANASKLDAPSRVEDLYGSGAFDALKTSALSGVAPVQSGTYQDWVAANGSGPSAAYSSGVLGGAPSASSSAGLLAGGGPDVGGSARLAAGGGPQIGASSGVLAGLDTGPSNATGVYDQAQGALGDQGALEDRYDAMGNAFNNTGAYENNFAENGDAFSNTGTFEDWHAKYGDDPMQKSYAETLYESGVEKLDPYYDYAEKRALDTAQNRSAARGGFNSGLAAQQESDITGNLRGQQAKQWVDFAPVADAARRARYGQGADFAKTAQDEYSSRIKSGFDVAAGQDKAYSDRINNAFNLSKLDQDAEEGRLDTLSGIAGRGDAADTARENTRVSAANNTDNASIGAFSALGDVVGRADSAANTKFATQGSIAGNADSTAADIYGSQVTAAGNADRTAVDSYRATADAQQRSEQMALDQWLANAGLAEKQDASTRLNLDALGSAAGAADASQMGRFTTQGGMAKDLQTTGQNRILGGLDSTMTQSQREAELARSVYADTQGIDNMDDTQLQALAGKYGVSLEELKSVVQTGGDVLGLLAKAFGK